MTNVAKIIVSILLILIIVSACTYTFAQANTERYKPGELGAEDKKVVGDTTSNILSYVRSFGLVLSVIVLTIIGLKYILGSVDEKAEYKKNAIPFIAGMVLLATATTIPSIVYDIAIDDEVTDYTIQLNKAKYIEPSFTYHGNLPEVIYSVISGQDCVELSQDINSLAITIKGIKIGTANIKITIKDKTSGQILETSTFTVGIVN